MKRSIFYLCLAILFESFGSTMLKLSAGFTVLWPSLGVVTGFLASFTCLSFALKNISLTTAYATWSGVGTALTAVIGVVLFHEHLSMLKVSALILIITGIVVMNKAKPQEAAAASNN
ncbi:QacE family quaternary ammonium compound efflux SMR transporter [Paenibacillaceae bacterium]|nr:QacE family quaternary ammonium compound efflux SMR transporter [Paenibacillaceae bacterium]